MLPSQQTDTVSDRIKLPYTFDVAKMLADVENMDLSDFTYYDVIMLRAPAYQVDSSLPEPPPAADYADGSWTDWLDTSQLQKATYLTEVVDFFRQHTKVNLVRLLRLEPEQTVREHTDPTLGLHIKQSVIRLTIPIQRPSEVQFFLNDDPIDMRPGECWYLRLTDMHRIDNKSDQVRINLTIDMIPNDWVREMIIGAVEA